MSSTTSTATPHRWWSQPALTGPTLIRLALARDLAQELQHATTLAGQVSFLGGTPTTEVPPVARHDDSESALRADLDLETRQLERYRERVQQATDMGLVDVAEALRPLLTQTQEHVRDLRPLLAVERRVCACSSKRNSRISWRWGQRGQSVCAMAGQR